MSQPLVIPLATPGLVVGDFGFRFYTNGTAVPAIAAALTITELAGGDYRVNGLPDGSAGNWSTLTWEYPAGAGAAFVYPQPQQGAPPNLVLPVREAGLLAADLELALYLDGVANGAVLTATEVGSPGDYRVSGWPTTTRGSWVLVWRRYGMSFSLGWNASGSISGYHGEANAFRDRLAANWSTTAIDWGVGFGGRKHNPADGVPYVRPGITNFRSAQRALPTSAGVSWRFTGDFWCQVFVSDTADDAAQKAEQYADSIAAIFRGQSFSGVRCYDASILRVGVSEEWFQVNVLVRFQRDETL